MSKKDKFEIPVIFDDDDQSLEKKESNSEDLDYIDKEKSIEEKKKLDEQKYDPERIPTYYRSEYHTGINRNTINSILGKETTEEEKERIRQDLTQRYNMSMNGETLDTTKPIENKQITDPLKEMREKEQREKEEEARVLEERKKALEEALGSDEEDEYEEESNIESEEEYEEDIPDEEDEDYDSEYDKSIYDDPYFDEEVDEEDEEEVVEEKTIPEINDRKNEFSSPKEVEKPKAVESSRDVIYDDFGNPVIKNPNLEPGSINNRRRDRDVVNPEVGKKIKFGDKKKKYNIPPLELLRRNGTNTPVNSSSVNYQISVINRTLADFKIGGKVINYTKGPTVTQFEIKLDPGVNVTKVSGITKNLQMNLESETIRIECPIPGKSTIGVEVPNIEKDKVLFGDLVSDKSFLNDGKPLNVILGLSIDGKPVYANIGDMPHCLIAGATGGGKTVCIYSIVTSILFKASPEEVKMVLIDPKRNELIYFEDIPHLATPIIDDPALATASLKWAVEEMDRRYDFLKANRKRTIGDYNEYAIKNNLKIIPYIVIVIDEFADLMSNASESFELNVQRLTQKARSAGIHLLIATQRPSTDVIKGTIKANIPSRIACKVNSPVDSMTILDHSGADKLLGKGDMLYTRGSADIRVQGAYISETELDDLSSYYYEQDIEPNYIFSHEELRTSIESENNNNGGDMMDDMADELLDEVAHFVFLNRKASANQIQTTYGTGFNRANRLLNALATLGIISSENIQGKARQVLVQDIDELEEILRNR